MQTYHLFYIIYYFLCSELRLFFILVSCYLVVWREPTNEEFHFSVQLLCFAVYMTVNFLNLESRAYLDKQALTSPNLTHPHKVFPEKLHSATFSYCYSNQ